MGLKPNTIWLLLIAMVFGGGMLVWELMSQPSTQTDESEQTQAGTQLFSFKEEDVEQVVVSTSGQRLVFKRAGQKSPAWTMKAPEEAPADAAAIAYLLSQLAAARSERSLHVKSAQLADYGLTPPTTTIQVMLKTKKAHTLVLGNSNFNDSALYAEVDPPSPRQYPLTIQLVPKTLRDAVTRPLAEWKSQPSPSPSSSPLPLDPPSP